MEYFAKILPVNFERFSRILNRTIVFLRKHTSVAKTLKLPAQTYPGVHLVRQNWSWKLTTLYMLMSIAEWAHQLAIL